MDDETNGRHRQRMARKKTLMDQRIAGAQVDLGGAPPVLIEAADTVTDMTLVKHAFQEGVRARRGVEW